MEFAGSLHDTAVVFGKSPSMHQDGRCINLSHFLCPSLHFLLLFVCFTVLFYKLSPLLRFFLSTKSFHLSAVWTWVRLWWRTESKRCQMWIFLFICIKKRILRLISSRSTRMVKLQWCESTVPSLLCRLRRTISLKHLKKKTNKTISLHQLGKNICFDLKNFVWIELTVMQLCSSDSKWFELNGGEMVSALIVKQTGFWIWRRQRHSFWKFLSKRNRLIKWRWS